MLEQCVASGVVVKDKIIDIDSDWYSHVIWCLWSFEYSITFIAITHSNYLWHGGGLRLIRRFKNLHLWLSQKSKSVTLAFKRWFSEASFGELTVLDFWFVKLTSCDLLLLGIWNETEKRHGGGLRLIRRFKNLHFWFLIFYLWNCLHAICYYLALEMKPKSVTLIFKR
jgi:hypothetical protein